MKFVFTEKKVNIPDRVRAYAEKKVGKLDRYFKGDAEATIVFSVEKERNNAEVDHPFGSHHYPGVRKQL
jgi:putative sigma-54 modulation protein